MDFNSPVYMVYLAGESAGPGGSETGMAGKNRLVLNSFAFVAGFTVVFVALGAAASALGHFLTGNESFLRRVSGVVMILFGMAFAFGWSPCFGPLLGTATIMAGNAKTLCEGISLLLLYSAGLGIPFIFTAVLFDRLRGSLRLLQKHERVIKVISGSILILAGILVFTDRLKYAGSW